MNCYLSFFSRPEKKSLPENESLSKNESLPENKLLHTRSAKSGDIRITCTFRALPVSLSVVIFLFFISSFIWSGYANSGGPVIVPLESYENNILDSGGQLLAEQAAYQVFYYDLDFFVDTDEQAIYGSAMTHARALDDMDRFVLHLDSVFNVHRVIWLHADGRHDPLSFKHDNGLIIADLSRPVRSGEQLVIEVSYWGSPRKAPNPPWEGGFTWSRSASGQPWIGVSCQINGADIWWPVKDHPSDRPDSVSVKVTVPADLIAVSNGVLRSREKYSDDTATYHWVTNYPISNYAVTVNIGPYVKLHWDYRSLNGELFPIYFWVLPENREKAEDLLEQVTDHMRFFERLLGPYPYWMEKYGIAETPFLGMEHQTLIAYGAGFKNDVVFDTGSGFDDLHHHELAHEWWGNMVTARDWKDFWIHEGFATYMQPLYAEELHGSDQYNYFMERIYRRITNERPAAPGDSQSTRQIFEGRDPYMKGAWVLHTLRHKIGDELFFKSLRRMSYPDSAYKKAGIRPPSRFVDTSDYISLTSQLTGRDLQWFFDTYLKYAELPELKKNIEDDCLYLEWEVPSGHDFPMPVPVYDGMEWVDVVPSKGVCTIIRNKDSLRIDPHRTVLRKNLFP